MTPKADVIESFDARDWAASFVKHQTENPTIATDEETMATWFANALMRGFDESQHTRQNPRRRVHRRSTYRERNFWELAVIASLHSAARPRNPGDCASAAVQEADVALAAWREPWAESEPIEEDD